MCAFAVVFLPKIIPSRERKKEKKYQGVSQVGLRLYFAVPLFFLNRNTSSCAKIQKKKKKKKGKKKKKDRMVLNKKKKKNYK